ncbi:MAG: hypothetical protein MEQ07_06825 [Aquimonas sp.]|nr:hypothetical protein [Aquimonas sp.]
MLLPLVAHAQSEASRASARLSDSLSALPRASGELAVAGGQLSVAALRPVGASMEVIVTGASDGARLSFVVGRDALGASGIVVGTVLIATVVSGGVLLWVGGEAVAFLLDERLVAHSHRQRISP